MKKYKAHKNDKKALLVIGVYGALVVGLILLIVMYLIPSPLEGVSSCYGTKVFHCNDVPQSDCSDTSHYMTEDGVSYQCYWNAYANVERKCSYRSSQCLVLGATTTTSTTSPTNTTQPINEWNMNVNNTILASVVATLILFIGLRLTKK
jgi:hypothetical protein